MFEADNGSGKFLVLIDEMTDYPCLFPLGSETTTKAVERSVLQLIAQFGVPKTIKTDGGPQFTSMAMTEFAQRWGIKLETSVPHLSRTNGKAEATVKVLKKLVAGSGGLGEKLAEGLLALRNTGVEGGVPPAVAAFGQLLRERALPCVEPVLSKDEIEQKREGAGLRREARRD